MQNGTDVSHTLQRDAEYNEELRRIVALAKQPRGSEPVAAPEVKWKFVTTIHAVVSGLIKLSKVAPAQGSTFRGISGRELSGCFLAPQPNGGRGEFHP